VVNGASGSELRKALLFAVAPSWAIAKKGHKKTDRAIALLDIEVTGLCRTSYYARRNRIAAATATAPWRSRLCKAPSQSDRSFLKD
jgi:hypothetical protein